MEWQTIAHRARRTGARHHSQALRLERGQIYPRNHFSGPGHARLLGVARLLEHGRSLERGSFRRQKPAAARVSIERDSMRTVYFDYNATTPLDPQVREAMLPYLG